MYLDICGNHGSLYQERTVYLDIRGNHDSLYFRSALCIWIIVVTTIVFQEHSMYLDIRNNHHSFVFQESGAYCVFGYPL